MTEKYIQSSKPLRDSCYKFSLKAIEKAQKNLRDKKVTKIIEENYEDYEKFVVDSYENMIYTAERVEYVKNNIMK